MRLLLVLGLNLTMIYVYSHSRKVSELKTPQTNHSTAVLVTDAKGEKKL